MKKVAISSCFIVIFCSYQVFAVYKKAALQRLSWILSIDEITDYADLELFSYSKLHFIVTRLNQILKPTKNPFSRYATLEKDGLLETALLFKDKAYEELSRRQPVRNDHQAWINNSSEEEPSSTTMALSIRSIAKSIGIKTVQSFSDLHFIKLGELNGLINLLKTCIKRDHYFLKNHATNTIDQDILTSNINFYENFLQVAQEEYDKRYEAAALSDSENLTDKEDLSDEEAFIDEEESQEDALSIYEQLMKAHASYKTMSVMSRLNHAICSPTSSPLSPEKFEDLKTLTLHFDELKLLINEKTVQSIHSQ